MKLPHFLIIVSALTARTCQPGIVLPTTSSDKLTSNLVEDLVKIVTSCYGDRSHTVVLVGNLPEALSRTLSTKHSIPVVLINDARNYRGVKFAVLEKFRYKVHVFVIEASTSQQLDIIFEMNTRYSIWWKSTASFLIVDRSPRCVNAENYLLVAWKHNAINAKVLCYGNETARTIYNYNPFTRQAPVPWQLYAVTRGVIDHPFTLFYRKYRANESICLNLDFQKTNDLGGYPIRVHGLKDYYKPFDSWKEYKFIVMYVFMTREMQHIAFRALNGTMISWRAGRYDISYTVDETVFIHKGFFTYPHTTMGTSLISQSRGYKTQHNKMLSAIDTYSLICLAIVYLLTFIFFKFLNHQAIIPAVLNIIRLTCNMAFTNLPDNTPAKIYVSFLLVFVIIMQVIIQSDLATLLTMKVPLQNVDTLEDVVTFGYKICSQVFLNDDINSPDLKGRKIKSSFMDCYRYAKNDTSVAYYGFRSVINFEEAVQLKMHISQRFVDTVSMAFNIRPHWALEEPVNSIIAKLVEADAWQAWEWRHKISRLEDLAVYQLTDNTNYKQMQLNDLSFAFVFLGFGLACATISFIFELVIGYKWICSVTIERKHSLPRCDPISYYYDVIRKNK